MKFKGKKSIMAAALSAIVATSSLSTISAADADDDYYFIGDGTACDYGATGTVEYGEWYVHAGDEITVTVTPGPNSYISNFSVYLVDRRGVEYLWYKHDTTTSEISEPIKHEFKMPQMSVKIYAAFGYRATPEPAEPATPVTPTTPTEPTTPSTPTLSWKKGDANCDGKVNAEDATAVLKHLTGIMELSYVGSVNADMDQNGKVTAADATEILKLLVSRS